VAPDVACDEARLAAGRLGGATPDGSLALSREEMVTLEIAEDAGDTAPVGGVVRRARTGAPILDCGLGLASGSLAIGALGRGAGSGKREQHADDRCERGLHESSPEGDDRVTIEGGGFGRGVHETLHASRG